MNTYSVESTWGTTLDFEEIRLMCWFIERDKADREAGLRRCMPKLRMCPLLIKVHGSWEAAFGLTPPKLIWEPPQIKIRPVPPSRYNWTTRAMCIAPTPIWTTTLRGLSDESHNSR